jgi:hypothetical protein
MTLIPRWLYTDLPFFFIVVGASYCAHELGHVAIPILLGWENVRIIWFPEGFVGKAIFTTPENVNQILNFLSWYTLGGFFQVTFLVFFFFRPMSEGFKHWIVLPLLRSTSYWIMESSLYFDGLRAIIDYRWGRNPVYDFFIYTLPVIIFIIWQEWRFKRQKPNMWIRDVSRTIVIMLFMVTILFLLIDFGFLP